MLLRPWSSRGIVAVLGVNLCVLAVGLATENKGNTGCIEEGGECLAKETTIQCEQLGTVGCPKDSVCCKVDGGERIKRQVVLDDDGHEDHRTSQEDSHDHGANHDDINEHGTNHEDSHGHETNHDGDGNSHNDDGNHHDGDDDGMHHTNGDDHNDGMHYTDSNGHHDEHHHDHGNNTTTVVTTSGNKGKRCLPNLKCTEMKGKCKKRNKCNKKKNQRLKKICEGKRCVCCIRKCDHKKNKKCKKNGGVCRPKGTNCQKVLDYKCKKKCECCSLESDP